MTDRGPGQVLFAFVRHWSRRPVTVGAVEEQGRLVQACEAVHSLELRGVSATVNAVADEIGIDQSGASRMIKSATQAGYLTMTANSADARRRLAALTSKGRTMLEQAHQWQEKVFAELTPGWSDEKRREFQQAMVELMECSYAGDARIAGPLTRRRDSGP